jgi:hypothetical protein
MWMMKTKTKKQIAAEAKELADVLANKDGSLIQRTLWQLALLIHELAEADAPASRKKK